MLPCLSVSFLFITMSLCRLAVRPFVRHQVQNQLPSKPNKQVSRHYARKTRQRAAWMMECAPADNAAGPSALLISTACAPDTRLHVQAYLSGAQHRALPH